MENSQLIAVLKTFSAKDIRDFKKWLASPFHNQSKDVVQLFEYLFKNDNLNKPKALKKDKVFQKIFPREKFDDARFRQTMHFLFKQIESFLTYCELVQDEIKNEIVLAKTYRKRKLDRSFEKTVQKIQKTQTQNLRRDSDYLYNNYLFQKEKFGYLAQFNRTSGTNLQESSDALDKSYVAERLKQSCLMLEHKWHYKVEYSHGILKAAINYVEAEDLLKEPSIAVYYHIYKLLTESENKDANFFELKKSIIEFGHLFPKTDMKDALLMAINYCIHKQNQGESSFVKESFDLYKYGIQRSLLIENNNISKLTFINISSFGIMLSEFEWVEQFLSQYNIYLKEKDQENIVNFCKGKLHFQKGQFDLAMDNFMNVKENDIILNLNSKLTLLKIYYKQDYHEVLLSLSDSMKKYIKRKDVPESYRKVYESIIRLMKKLVKVNPFNKTDIQKLRKEIEETPTLPNSERGWLLEQVEEL